MCVVLKVFHMVHRTRNHFITINPLSADSYSIMIVQKSLPEAVYHDSIRIPTDCVLVKPNLLHF